MTKTVSEMQMLYNDMLKYPPLTNKCYKIIKQIFQKKHIIVCQITWHLQFVMQEYIGLCKYQLIDSLTIKLNPALIKH